MTWKAKTPNSDAAAFYAVIESSGGDEMTDLRSLFPDPEKQINEMNFVLFGTGGVHGSYTSIDEVEEWVLSEGGANKPWDASDPDSTCPGVTFLIVHPRQVALRYGVAQPRTKKDIDFLKLLKNLSSRVLIQEADV